jgi:hypothetical protein
MSDLLDAVRYTAREALRAWRRYWALRNGANPDVCQW